MAQAEFDGFVPSAGAVGRIVNVIGALSSVALVLGVGWWGYKLAVRDVNGVPVIQALQGPTRIAPTDPEGQVAAHKGLSVNQVAAQGTAAPLPERITLAPGTVGLTDEDTPGIGGTAMQVPPPRPAALETDPGIVASLALPDQMTSGVAPLVSDPIAAPDAIAEAATLPGTMRPRPRPARPAAPVETASIDATDAIAAATAAVLAQALSEVEPSDSVPVFGQFDLAALTEGTRLAQVGAFDDEASAIREWDRLSAQHSDVFVGKARVIQPATSAGRTFYRLRVHGFDSEEASRAFCTRIEAPDLRCIPVIHR